MRYRNSRSQLLTLALLSVAACLLSALALSWSVALVLRLPVRPGLLQAVIGAAGILTGTAGVLVSTWVLASVAAARLASRHHPSHRAQPWARTWLDRHGSPLVRRVAAGGLALGASLGAAPLAHAVTDDLSVQPATPVSEPLTGPGTHQRPDTTTDAGAGDNQDAGTAPDDLTVGRLPGGTSDPNGSGSDEPTDRDTATGGPQPGPDSPTAPDVSSEPEHTQPADKATPPAAQPDPAASSQHHLAAGSPAASTPRSGPRGGSPALATGQPWASARGSAALARALDRLYSAGPSSPARSASPSVTVLPDNTDAVASSTTATAPDTVTVAAGDCLWSIAADQLRVGGQPHPTNAQIAAAWPLLYHANRDLIGEDPSLIYPGTTLSLPASLTPGEHP